LELSIALSVSLPLSQRALFGANVAAAPLGVFIQSAEFAAFGSSAPDSFHRYATVAQRSNTTRLTSVEEIENRTSFRVLKNPLKTTRLGENGKFVSCLSPSKSICVLATAIDCRKHFSQGLLS